MAVNRAMVERERRAQDRARLDAPVHHPRPFDDAPELNNETYYGRSAWQVKSIEIY